MASGDSHVITNGNIPTNTRTNSNTTTKTTTKPVVAPKPKVALPTANTAITNNTVPVPGKATNVNQQNVADYAGQVVKDPSQFFDNNMLLSENTPTVDANTAGTNIDGTKDQYQMDNGALAQNTATVNDVAQADQVTAKDAATYEATNTQDNISQNAQANAAQGQVSDEAKITAAQHDQNALATGQNADGSVNETGKALNDYASQNISNIIDTSTPAGKALAQALGDGNYTDSKATLKGQLDILQGEFQDENGNPKIPVWAAATARNVSKIAAFSGMTGTAATAAMAQALMEASIPVAQQDAQFFQTVTLQNLSNKQAMTLNKANVLAKFESENLDARMTAAVENAKSFLQMDLANLDNAQQAEIINAQTRAQSILEDAKAQNVAKQFNAQSQNELTQFYDSLNSSISQFNAAQMNGMKQFNASETNDMSQFNAQMENNREQFYKEMQYNIDVANAKWRQEVTMKNADMTFEAAATDVKNMVGLAQEQLNQIWDRSDALLDYAFKSSENEKDRKAQVAIAQLQAKLADKSANHAAIGSAVGAIAGKAADGLLSWAFG